MSLNIKNERVHALAREAARRAGKTQTSVIKEAPERFLAELRGDDAETARRQRLRRLLAEIRADTTEEQRAATRRVQDEMYDESGLPE